ncbi:MAG: DMT family transporter [Alphaproteobacteria bacterium]
MSMKADKTRVKNTVFLGVFLALLGGLLMTGMDVTAKILTETYPAGEIGLARNWFALPILAGIFFIEAWWRKRNKIRDGKTPSPLTWRLKSWKIALVRGVLIAIAQFLFFMSLAHLPLATVASIFYVAPAFITILSVLIFKESVGVWRWNAVVIGFVGVLLINRPGTDVFSIWTLLPVITALCYAISLTIVRVVDIEDSNALFTFYTVLCSGFVSILWILIDFEAPIAADFPLFVLLGVFGSFGAYALNWGFRLASPSVIAPFEYLTLIFAFVVGWVIWRELPETYMWPGIFLILASGVVILIREEILRRRENAKPSKS